MKNSIENTYYKAEIFLSTESMDWDEKENAYIGYDPDTHSDHGIIETITADSLEKLLEKVSKKHDLSKFEEFEGRLEAQFDGEHDYRTPEEDQIPFMEIYTLIISRVEVQEVHAHDFLKNNGGN